ncbi:MAG: NTP transferase domain-containing protein [Bacteroidetes bacterium]|nr:NTP transferase domain-containing protein [Bacteroidota bacterium]
MYKVNEIKISPDTSIRKALEIIDWGAMKIALITDENDKLIGTLTDGDIRRGLLQGMGMEDQIITIYNRTPIVCRITDPKEKVIQTAISRRIYQIPLVNDKGQVVKLAEIDHLIRKEKHPNTIVLMAGGMGRRLLPLTENPPKPMLQVGGRPILETLISRLQQQGFSNIIISINYKGEQIKEYFEDGRKFGVSITYLEEHQKMGTAGSLGLLKTTPGDPVMVMNGDILTNVNFENLLDFHNQAGAAATMCIREYGLEVPYGVVRLNQDNIIAIEEKPVQQFYVNAGIYVLNPSVISNIPKDQPIDMTQVFEKLVKSNAITVSFPIREFWMDIGKLEDYNRANNEYYRIFNE